MSAVPASTVPLQGKRVAIIQSNYIPWKGYFDIIKAVDLFVLLDDVQYTRRDWRNRNRIKTPTGLQWLTVPVLSKGRYLESIDEIQIAAPWAESHWDRIVASYRKADCFGQMDTVLRRLFESVSKERRLSTVNLRLLEGICRVLGISTPICYSAEFPHDGIKTDRLLSICRAAGAARYVSGPSARDYLDLAKFAAVGVAVDWVDYHGYPEYPQLYGAFAHHVSIIDLLFNVGAESQSYMKRVV